MAAAIGLRDDYDAGALRAAARRSKNGAQARRLLALAAIYDGAARAEAAKIGGVTLQIIRDWVLKLNAHGPDGLIDRKAPGQAPRLNDTHRAALAAIIESGPIPAVHGVVRWRIVDLCQWIFEESCRRLPADPEPGIARHGLSQAVGSSAASRASRRRD
jgi:transposase